MNFNSRLLLGGILNKFPPANGSHSISQTGRMKIAVEEEDMHQSWGCHHSSFPSVFWLIKLLEMREFRVNQMPIN